MSVDAVDNRNAVTVANISRQFTVPAGFHIGDLVIFQQVAVQAQKDGYGFEYMRNIRDGSLEMRIFKGRFGERVTLPVREVVEHETSGTGHKLIFDTYFALKDQYERDEVWM